MKRPISRWWCLIYDHLSEESAFGDLSPEFTNDIVEPRIAYDPKHHLQNVTIEVEKWN